MNCSLTTTMRSSFFRGLLRTLALFTGIGGTVILICSMAFTFHRADPDLWGHVQYGRDALREGLPATTTYSFTAEGFPWINHENLCELLFASVIDHFGVPSMLILKMACGLLVLAMAAWHARRQHVSWPVIGGSSLLLASVMAHFWPLRPQFVSYTLFALLIGLVSFAFTGWQDRWHLPWLQHGSRDGSSVPEYDRWRLRWLWLVPALMFVWANSHGAFMAGLSIYIAYLGLRAFEASCGAGQERFGMVRRLAMMVVVAVLATFLNPYGPRLQLWLLETLSAPPPEITEWQSIRFSDPVLGPFILLVVAGWTGLVYSRQQLDATHLCLLALTFWQSCAHWRHLPFLAILVAFWLPIHWQSAWTRFNQAARRHLSAGFSGKATAVGPVHWYRTLPILAVNIALAAVIVTRCQQITVDRSYYPVSAIEFMHQHDLHGRLVVTFNWAQYALGVLAAPPQDHGGTRISFDGRFNTCYPQVVIDEHFDFVLGNDASIRRHRGADSPEPRPEAILERGEPELVLNSREQEHSVLVMGAQLDHWVLLYQDSLAQVWGRREIFDDPSNPRYLPPADRQLAGGRQRGLVAWPARPDALEPATRWVRWLAGDHDNLRAESAL